MAFPTELDCLRPLTGTLPGERGKSTLCLSPRQNLSVIRTNNGCQQAEAVSIAFAIATGRSLLPAAKTRITGMLPLPRARVQWGAGNAGRPWVDIDLRSGTSLSVVCEAVEVDLRYDVAFPPWTEEDPCALDCMPTFSVETLLGYGGCCRATFTEVAFVETPGEETLINIPPFAESFTVLPNIGSEVSAHIRFPANIYDVENVIVSPLSNKDQFNGTDQIPIPNGAMWIAVKNTDDEPVTAFVVFRIGT